MKNRFLFAMTLSTFAAGAVFASQSMKNDAMPVANAKISMAQAIVTAEQHVHGKASKAEFENTRSGWAYDVEVVSGDKVFDVTVDADKGNVIASTEDKSDRDDHDKRD